MGYTYFELLHNHIFPYKVFWLLRSVMNNTHKIHLGFLILN